MRVQTIQVARQRVITYHNVPVSIDAVLSSRSTADAVIKVQDFRFVISQDARTSLPEVIGQMMLDQLLAEREPIEAAIAMPFDAHGIVVVAHGRGRASIGCAT